jgi:hypothetical protein
MTEDVKIGRVCYKGEPLLQLEDICMRYGFVLPGGDARLAADLAAEAEAAGWDGVFYPDCICIGDPNDPMPPVHDPWVVLTAMAMRTERVMLGAMVTPLSRRRPWKVARETMTLDRLSNGRLVLPVGLGALDDAGFGKVGEATDRKVRAEMLDESLAILAGLWSGQPFSFQGKHYHVDEMTFLPTPMQTPRIPVWVVGAWPRTKSMERVLRWDGILPNILNADGSFGETTPEQIVAMQHYVAERRPPSSIPFEIIVEGRIPDNNRAQIEAKVRPLAEAGATWWIESMWSVPNGPDDVRARIRQGPPRV